MAILNDKLLVDSDTFCEDMQAALENAEKSTIVLDPELYTPRLTRRIAEIEAEVRNMDIEYVRIALLTSQGFSTSEISDKTGVTTEQLAYIIKSTEYSAAVELLTRQVKYYAKAVLVTMVPKALGNLYSLLDSGNDKIKLAAAKEILNRLGIVDLGALIAATDRDNSRKDLSAMSDEQLKAILEGTA